ncbi:LysR family transcriptional regulator [Lutimaribacter marinistellae]|uniref:LysR family transcriptional regulator n=1 Tax=Lutimaribacter marinistellae TaxID=1820329 RepID=A0ABV7TFR8_9RHOB
MDDLNELRAFLRVAESGSFAEAARLTGQSTSSISKAVRRLEEKLGVKLLSRTTRSLSRTSEGERLVASARLILDEVDAVESAFNDSAEDPRGKLVISAPEAFGRAWMTERVLAFMARHENVEIELQFDDRIVDLVTEGIDLAIRTGSLGNSPNLIARRFFDDKIHTCAAPAYLEKTGVPQTLKDLDRFRAVYYRNQNTGRLIPFRFKVGDESVPKSIETVLVANSIHTLEQAGAAGLGLVQLPGFIARRSICEGRLVEVLSEFRSPLFRNFIVYPERRLVPPRVRAFADFLIADPPTVPEVPEQGGIK